MWPSITWQEQDTLAWLVRQPLTNLINMSASKRSVVCHRRKWKVVTEHGHTLQYTSSTPAVLSQFVCIQSPYSKCHPEKQFSLPPVLGMAATTASAPSAYLPGLEMSLQSEAAVFDWHWLCLGTCSKQTPLVMDQNLSWCLRLWLALYSCEDCTAYCILCWFSHTVLILQ